MLPVNVNTHLTLPGSSNLAYKVREFIFTSPLPLLGDVIHLVIDIDIFHLQSLYLMIRFLYFQKMLR